MKIAFHLAHPAHFYLFRNVIHKLLDRHNILITYNEKDVLEALINNSDFKPISAKIRANTNINNKLGLIYQFLCKNIGLFKTLKRHKPDLILGTSIIIAHSGKLLGIPNIIVNEDDFDIVKKTAAIGYPFTSSILCPSVCRTGRWTRKSKTYEGYHELAYLHPNNFTPNREVVNKYFDHNRPYFIIRFAKLVAHHDEGIKGIDSLVTENILKILEPKGRVYITSERDLEPKLESFRLKIDPLDMHHFLSYATMYIGDSQTMTAEAAVLGTPALRFNDFVGRISYLEELETKYRLTFGVKTNNADKLYDKIRQLVALPNLKAEWQNRRRKMLSEKIDVAAFMTWLIENYPSSIDVIKKDPHYQFRFK